MSFLELATPLPAASPAPHPRILLAPVTVTPSKPLTPSHLKGLLWTDVMFRATAQLADVTYRYSPTTYHLTEQTLGFWEYLDRTAGDEDYSSCTEEEIGERYIRFRAEPHRAPAAALRPYAEAVEHQGWVHPSARRVLDLWSGWYRRLGLHDPGLTRHSPPGMSLDEVLSWLDARNACIDQRDTGGPVYLDATRHGVPLRRVVAADGRPNYLACALRELIPLTEQHDEAVLIFDQELAPDYVLLQRLLDGPGRTVERVPLGRVPLDGTNRSARHGGWDGRTARALIERVAAGHDDPVLRLGMRLYFIAVLGPGTSESFRPELLRGCLRRAAKLLDRARPTGPDEVRAALERSRGKHLHVDPYRLTSALLRRHGPAPSADLLEAVYL